jgi:hypothetical protein
LTGEISRFAIANEQKTIGMRASTRAPRCDRDAWQAPWFFGIGTAMEYGDLRHDSSRLGTPRAMGACRVHAERAIRVESVAARFTMTIEGVPSEENPRTGRLTPLSLLACLRGLVAPLKVGS